jgi:hypothetical protein
MNRFRVYRIACPTNTSFRFYFLNDIRDTQSIRLPLKICTHRQIPSIFVEETPDCQSGQHSISESTAHTLVSIVVISPPLRAINMAHRKVYGKTCSSPQCTFC